MSICSMPKPEKNFRKLSQDEFCYLNSQGNLIQKILAMEEMLWLTDQEFYEREKIVADITNLLRKYYPDCAIKIYGSSANGFGFKGCDLDLLFLPFPEYCNLDFKGKGNGVIPSPHQVLKGSYSREDLINMEEETHLKFVQRIMYTKKYYFKRIFFIPAKCPILNIEFVKNTISCDFSASNRLVVHNTELLCTFGRLDSRVRPLVMLLRYWAKSLGFITKNLLSSYCFTLMVIFYLQTTQPCVLPSVKYLNELAGYSRLVDGWETAICTDPVYINAYRYENTSSIDQFLMKFFDFYLDFDFIQNVVSPHFGKPLSVTELKKSNDERIRSFQVTPFSIQDPFILSPNISRNATMKTSFKLALLIAKKVLLNRNLPFQLLFDLSYYQDEMDEMFAPTRVNLPASSTFFSLQLSYELCCKLGITDQLDLWFKAVCQIILDILQYGLLLECEVVDKIMWPKEEKTHLPKRRKVSAHSAGDLELVMSIQCVVHFPTLWTHNRKQVKDSKDDKMDETELPECLRKDYKISKELTKGEIKPLSNVLGDETESPYLRFMCNCFQYSFAQVSDIVVGFSPLTSPKAFGEVKDFLKSFVRKHAKKILEEDQLLMRASV